MPQPINPYTDETATLHLHKRGCLTFVQHENGVCINNMDANMDMIDYAIAALQESLATSGLPINGILDCGTF